MHIQMFPYFHRRLGKLQLRGPICPPTMRVVEFYWNPGIYSFTHCLRMISHHHSSIWIQKKSQGLHILKIYFLVIYNVCQSLLQPNTAKILGNLFSANSNSKKKNVIIVNQWKLCISKYLALLWTTDGSKEWSSDTRHL